MAERHVYDVTIPKLKSTDGSPAKGKVLVISGTEGMIHVQDFLVNGVKHGSARIWCRSTPEPEPDAGKWPTIKWEEQTAKNKAGEPYVIGQWRMRNSDCYVSDMWDGHKWRKVTESARYKILDTLFPVLVENMTKARRLSAELDQKINEVEAAERGVKEAQERLREATNELTYAVAAKTRAEQDLNYLNYTEVQK